MRDGKLISDGVGIHRKNINLRRQNINSFHKCKIIYLNRMLRL